MLKWPASASFDPKDEKDFTVDWTAEMEKYADIITGATFTVDTVETGLEITQSGVDQDGMKTVVWLKAADMPLLESLIGTTVEIDHTVETRDNRVLNRLLGLKIKDR